MEEYKKTRRDSSGKLVNVGNFDSDGVNVNSNQPDYSNDNLGVAFSRSLCRRLDFFQKVGSFGFLGLRMLFIQPPNILPISSKLSCNARYFF